MKYDIAAKVVIEKGKEAILRRFLNLDPDNIQIIDDLPEETATLRRSDFLLRVGFRDGSEEIVLIEVQTEFDRDFVLRLIEYTVRAMLKYHLNVKPMVLILKPSKLATGYYKNEVVSFKYKALRFWEENPNDFLDEVSLYPFLPLMKGGEKIVDEVDRRINNNPELNMLEKADLLTAMAIFAGFKDKNLASKLTKRRRDIMMRSPTYDILFGEMEEEIMQKGMQKGILQSLIDILELRFEFISDKLIEKINDVTNVDTLRRLQHLAVKCNSLQEFEEKLRLTIEN